MFEFLAKLFRPRPKLGAEAIQSAFREQFRNFRALLTANNNALELMSSAEETLHSGKPFGMAFVRGEMTALTVNVYKMVHSLVVLSDGRYRGLYDQFALITAQIETILSRQPVVAGTALVLGLDAIDRSVVDQVGAKMANLGEMRKHLGLRVPDGFAVTATAARQFMESTHIQNEINRRLKTLDIENLESLYTVSADIQDLIRATLLPDDLDRAILQQVEWLAERAGRPLAVSMRSSALGEDGMQGSFAGQYRTRLWVDAADIPATYRDIVAGKYQSQAIVYHQQRGYRHQDVLMCVGCLVMIDAQTSGVAYSRPADDPESTAVVIYAAPGRGTHIVDGSSSYDLLFVSREAPHAVTFSHLADTTGGRSCLTEEEARELALVSLRIESHFGSPQDIEWAIDRHGTLFILQARPLDAATGCGVAGPEAERLAPEVGQPEDQTPLLAGGVTASRGAAAGEVFKVLCALDMLEFPKGAVLVVETPYPEWAVLMNRAVAVVSETGQSATHLATVAREFGVPALFDLPGAVAGLENGQVVTVCATARRVYDGRVDALLAAAPRLPNLMAGSPIHKLLKDALTHITPLHLTVPDSPFFKPSSCRTLHDITRFCHEKALAEMFNFGRRYGSRDKSAKQLYVVDMPSQWWVINLKDGYREETDLASPFIRIEDIVSEPMLAIWKGMTAVPWEGPPPVSLRGFGAIIAQSAMNPQIDPAVRSNMTGRNYFLLSKKYCNLSVRLGYHFALAEANFSELLTESYVNFQFQGGAADERRRRRRVRLLGEMLRELDFRVDIKNDSLTARIEKRPVPYLKERLVVLGYLLIHTRQVDMVMNEDAFISRYLEKIQADIRLIREGMIEDEKAGQE
ncbi:MAG: pyruvate, water dikinase [Gammaproteobacteria bacterium]|nr:pyruvate, water dikinase [Rhodocyclaceae bacterium]MBU3910284.1 pyruvate, water dikinase [Gammaproteobacteria bacterium]MBU4004111.1 pyruvate, water dikinase [Gammaproteobacteria bacterium]MBU4020358.1 pyruvate, water dikinase [Gammaproteobacteria bacterium]MBU4095434.1 pyruvate, water dikinase [Gammaproteobacteria bacterium]